MNILKMNILPCPGSFRQASVFLDYDEEFTLYVFIPNVTNLEVQEIKEGMYKFGLTIFKDIMFFCCIFVGGTEYLNTPFHFGLYSDDRIKNLPTELTDNKGITLNIKLFDAVTKTVKALRTIELSHKFSEKLLKICHLQALEKIEEEEYSLLSDSYQRKYLSRDLYSIANIKCVGWKDENGVWHQKTC